jgi:hypothetical protein
MADRPRYEAEPSPRFLAALRAAVPGFEPTPLGWIEFEIELKRRLRLRDQAAYAANHQACWEWSEDQVLEVFTPPAAAPPPAAARPGFPAMPLDPWCVVSADLSLETREEIVRLVRLVQTDFDPENDPRGWDSVAVLVRGVGYGEEEARLMGYPQLAAIFRTSAAQMRLQKTGSLMCGIATSTSTIVSLKAEPTVAGEKGSESQTQKRKMRPEEHLVILYGRDPTVATLESRSLPAVAESQFGESYSDRAYRGTDLYGEWRGSLEDSVRRHGSGWLEGDVLEAGLEIYGSKPGRSDKRRTMDAEHEAAVKAFFRDAANATARAKARLADGGK